MRDSAVIYTRAEAAKRARIGISTLDELIKQNAFPVKRPSPRRVVIPGPPFDRWLGVVESKDQ